MPHDHASALILAGPEPEWGTPEWMEWIETTAILAAGPVLPALSITASCAASDFPDAIRRAHACAQTMTFASRLIMALAEAPEVLSR